MIKGFGIKKGEIMRKIEEGAPIDQNSGEGNKEEKIDAGESVEKIPESESLESKREGLEEEINEIREQRGETKEAKHEKFVSSSISKAEMERVEWEPEWDVEKEVSEQDCETIREQLKDYREASRRDKEKYNDETSWWSWFAKLSANAKLLDRGIEIDFDKEAETGAEKALELYRRRGKSENNWDDFLSLAGSMKIINPEKDIEIDSTTWEAIQNQIEDNKINDRWSLVAPALVNVKMINPEKVNISDKDREGMEKEFDGFREEASRGFYGLATNMKILYPDFDPHIGQELWKKEDDLLQWWRNEDNANFFAYEAASMKILSSPKVEIPPEGGLKVE